MSDNPWTSSGPVDREPNWRSPEHKAYSLFPSDAQQPDAQQLLWDPEKVLPQQPEPEDSPSRLSQTPDQFKAKDSPSRLSQTPDQFKASVLAKLAQETIVLKFHNTNAWSLRGFFEKLDGNDNIEIAYPRKGRPASITIQKPFQGVETLLDNLFHETFTAQKEGISACYIQEDEVACFLLGEFLINSTAYVELQQVSGSSGGVKSIEVTCKGGRANARALNNRLNSNLR
jgi:hypothetical protein